MAGLLQPLPGAGQSGRQSLAAGVLLPLRLLARLECQKTRPSPGLQQPLLVPLRHRWLATGRPAPDSRATARHAVTVQNCPCGYSHTIIKTMRRKAMYKILIAD